MQYIKKNVVSETLHIKYHRKTPDEQCLVPPKKSRVGQNEDKIITLFRPCWSITSTSARSGCRVGIQSQPSRSVLI